jgi:hypothetical protein
MIMRKHIFQRIAVAVCGFALCGCITQNETTYRNPERAKVEFENEAAARIFYETLSKMSGPNSRHETSTTVEIPVVMEIHNKVVDGENVGFNNAVKECDSNQDGKITEMEARIFAERHPK